MRNVYLNASVAYFVSKHNLLLTGAIWGSIEQCKCYYKPYQINTDNKALPSN
ncbi:MAG: hypothetical protein R2852_04515 [Bacteroidia bacterium]